MSVAAAPSIEHQSKRNLIIAIIVGVIIFVAFGTADSSIGVEAAPDRQAALAVDVDLSEWDLVSSQFDFQQGDTVIFNIINTGRFPHNLEVSNTAQHLVSPTIGAGEVTTLEVTFDNSGTYAIICSVPGHAGLGMNGELTVSGGNPAPSEGEYLGVPAMRLSPRSGTEVEGTSQEVRVILHDFTLDADSIGGDNVAGEGHWALYLDDELVASLGEPSFLLEDLASGDRTIRVELRNNDGTPVEPALEASATVQVVAAQPVAIAATPSVGGTAPGILVLASTATLGLVLLGSGVMVLSRRRV